MTRPILPQIVARPGDACPSCPGRLQAYSTRRVAAVAVQYLRCSECRARFRSLRPPAALRRAPNRNRPRPAARRLLNAFRRAFYRLHQESTLNAVACFDLTARHAYFLAGEPDAPIGVRCAQLVQIVCRDASLRDWLWAKALLPAGAIAVEAEPDDEVAYALQQRGVAWPELWAHLPTMIDLLQFSMRRLAVK